MKAAILAGLKALADDNARKAFLSAAYTEQVGYDPFEDDPNATIESVADLFAGVVTETIQQGMFES